jgi:hypothetical protein
MKIESYPPGGGPTKPPATPADPNAIALSRYALEQARDAVLRAIVSTTKSDRIDPALPFWSHRAVENIGYATAMMDIVRGTEALTHIPIPLVVYTDNLEKARRLIVDAAANAQAGRPVDPNAFADAKRALESLVHQYDFDIHRRDPKPPSALVGTLASKWG